MDLVDIDSILMVYIYGVLLLVICLFLIYDTIPTLGFNVSMCIF